MLMMLTALRFNKNETRLHKLSYWSTSETALLVLCGTFQHSISDISGVTKICPQKSIKDAKIMEGQCRKAWWVRGQGRYWAYHECYTMPRGYGSTYVCIRSYVPFWDRRSLESWYLSLKFPNPKKRIISWVLNFRSLYHIESCSVWICFSVNICQTTFKKLQRERAVKDALERSSNGKIAWGTWLGACLRGLSYVGFTGIFG